MGAREGLEVTVERGRVDPEPCTLHPAPYTLNPEPCGAPRVRGPARGPRLEGLRRLCRPRLSATRGTWGRVEGGVSPSEDLIENGFKLKTFMQGSLLHSMIFTSNIKAFV